MYDEITVATALQQARQLLIKSNTKYLDGELLLAHVLKKSRTQIISYPEIILTPQQSRKFYKLLSEREKGKSIAQILGYQEFWGRDFFVSEHTLVPRADSETLITAVLQLVQNKKSVFTIGDFGTGTGCLIITILLEYMNAQGIAFEKSKLAYNAAYMNLQKYQLKPRLKMILDSWEKCRKNLDIIISNPPYIRKKEIDLLPVTIRHYEPKMALDGGNNGLNCYRSIMNIAKKYLKRSGYLILEIGDDSQVQALRNIAKQYGLQLYKTLCDLSGSVRCLVFQHQFF